MEGVLGRLVDGMIRRSVRTRFRRVYWRPAPHALPAPSILVANHHGWYDGYLLYLAATAMGVRVVDWIAEFDAFPLFARVGGMPFPPHRPEVRAATIRRTIRLMREERRSLMLFAEGTLHTPPELWPFGGALDLVRRKVPNAAVVPVAIRYDMSMHERPEAIVMIGSPLEPEKDVRTEVQQLLGEADRMVHTRYAEASVLHEGTLDVNERLDMRKFGLRPGAGSR